MENKINYVKLFKLKKGDVLVMSVIDVDPQIAKNISKIIKVPVILVPDINNLRVIRSTINEHRTSKYKSVAKKQPDKD